MKFKVQLLSLAALSSAPLIAMGPAPKPKVYKPESLKTLAAMALTNPQQQLQGQPIELQEHASFVAQFKDTFARKNYDALLLWAINENNTAIIRELVGLGVDVNLRFGKLTPLMLAAKKGHAGCIDALLQADADLEAQDDQNKTACMWAGISGNTSCLTALIRAGCNKEALDDEGRTTLIWAATEGRAECLQLLINAGANVNHANAVGNTALMRAADCGHAQCIAVLLDAGANAALENINLENALMRAAASGELECLQLLISNTKVAIARNLMQRLIDSGVNINYVDPTTRGADCGDLQCIVKLLTTRVVPQDATLFQSALDHVDCLDLFVSQNIFRLGKALEKASLLGYTKCVNELLQISLCHGDAIHRALIAALRPGHLECVRLIIQAAQSDDYSKDSILSFPSVSEETPLLVAAQEGNITALELLLDAGANPNFVHSYLLTPNALIEAVRRGRDECARLLVKYGARTNVPDADGKTAITFALEQGREDLANELLRIEQEKRENDKRLQEKIEIWKHI